LKATNEFSGDIRSQREYSQSTQSTPNSGE